MKWERTLFCFSVCGFCWSLIHECWFFFGVCGNVGFVGHEFTNVGSFFWVCGLWGPRIHECWFFFLVLGFCGPGIQGCVCCLGVCGWWWWRYEGCGYLLTWFA